MSEAVHEAYVLQPGEGRLIDLGGFSMSVKATDDQTDGMFTLLEADEPPDFGPPLHPPRDRGGVLRSRRRVHHLSGRERVPVPGRVVHLHPRRDPPWVPGGQGGEPETQLLPARVDGRVLR
jgi:hypothetical protein